tara:strand:- start:52 stop:1065 length:1014 start_codon:yes stop_codon:yes gene_type:complete
MPYTTINKSTDHFNTKLFTGNESAGHAITGVGFQPDFTWFKNTGGTDSHSMYDSVRGVTKQIEADTSGAETTESTGLASFDSDGFTVGTRTASNSNGMTIASWNWKMGTTSGISAGSQTITPSAYSINATAGMGIYKWSRTGASTSDYFSHGLGATPVMAWQKRTDGSQDWYVNFTVRDGSNDYMQLNKTTALTDDSTTAPTSTNYYPKSPETGTYVTYLFAEKKGFSKFGIYYGSHANYPFVYTGFKPAWVMIKSISTTNWNIIDNKNNGYNVDNDQLYANSNSAEATGNVIDFVSNGFRIRTTAADVNNNNTIHVYSAFAEAPLVGSNNVPATAR